MTRTRLTALLCVAVTLGACGTGRDRGYASSEDGVRICPAGETVPGVDVSHWNESINWSQVSAAGYKFAFTKASEGTTYSDPTFSTYWAGIKAAGMYRGAYHFFKSGLDGAAQADAFLATVGTLGQPGDLPPVLDWEQGSGGCDSTASVRAQTIARAQAFLDRVEQRTGIVPIIYTAAGYWSECGAPIQFSRYPLWVANYVALSTCPTTPPTWSSWKIWQYSESGSVNGIVGDVDMNIYNGTLAELAAFANASTSTQTAGLSQVSGNEAITMVNWTDGRASLFARSTSGSELVLSTSGANDSWSSSSSIDTGAMCGSAASFWGGTWNYPELFSPLEEGVTGHLWWTSSGTWRSYQTFGGAGLRHLSTTVSKDGRTWAFGLGSDGAIWINSWNTGSSAWNGWTSLGGSFVTGAGAITWGNGTIELFATQANGTVKHTWLINNTTTWAAWETLGSGIASRPVAVRWSDGGAGHAEVFARGMDGKLYHSNYQSGWPAFSSLGSGAQIQGEPSAVMNPTTMGPEVFARDSSNYVVRLAWNGTSYSSFARVGSQVTESDPFGWTRKDGTTNVFAIDTSGRLMTTHATGSSWSTWTSLGSGFDSCVEDTPVTPDGGMPVDAGTPFVDAGPPDAGPRDAGPPDAGPPDAGPRDAGPPDAGPRDAGPPDAGPIVVDAGPPDAGPPDAGPAFVDAGPSDAGPVFVDAGPADAGAEMVVDAGGTSVSDGGTFTVPPKVPTAKPAGCQCSSGAPTSDVVAWFSLGGFSVVRRWRRATDRRRRLE